MKIKVKLLKHNFLEHFICALFKKSLLFITKNITLYLIPLLVGVNVLDNYDYIELSLDVMPLSVKSQPTY